MTEEFTTSFGDGDGAHAASAKPAISDANDSLIEMDILSASPGAFEPDSSLRMDSSISNSIPVRTAG